MLHTHIAFLRKLHVSALLAASFLLVFSMLAIFPVASSFSDTQAASTISETTLNMTTANINLALSVDSASGTFNASDPASFTVATNNYSGYTLGIRAAEDDVDYSKLVNGEAALNSISSAGASSTFNNGNWGYLPSKINSAVNTDYQPAPTYAGTTIDTTAQANNEANSYSIAIGAKVNYGLPAGKYSNTFVITAVANPVGYSITYNKNTEDEVTNMPANQSGDASSQSIILSSDEPVRSGYNFINWCDGTTTTTSGVDSCTGTVYQPGDSYDTDQTAQNNLVLKAMWEQVAVAGYTINFDAGDGSGSMNPQVIPYGESANLNTSTFTAPNGYTFDKWNTASDGTGTDYAAGTSFTAPADDTGGSSIILYAQYKTAVYDTIVFDGNGSDGGTAMSNQQILQGTSADLNANTYTKSGYSFNGWSTTTDDLGQGYGDEDKYFAADTGTAQTITLYAKWEQPICIENCGSGSGDSPVYESGITIQRAYEMAYTQHHKGMYEEITPGSGTYQWIDSWSIDDNYDNDSYLGQGREVRFSMQDIKLTYNNGDTDINVCNLVTVIGDQYQALDVRDNKLYYIAKLADGRCWMTQNLDLDLVHVANDADALYTHDNTDLGYTTNDPTAKWNPSASTISMGDISGGNPNNWVQDAVGPVSGDVGDAYMASPGESYTNGTFHSSLADCITNSASHSEANCKHYHMGNYYNYGAAVAENNMNTSAYQTRFAQVENSICPAGWRLPVSIPTGFTNSNGNNFSDGQFEYSNLFYIYQILPGVYDWDVGGIQFLESPLYFTTTAGIYDYNNSSVMWGFRSGGDYWSSTLGGNVNSTNQNLGEYTAFILASDVDEGLTPTKAQQGFNGGYPVRCIAR